MASSAHADNARLNSSVVMNIYTLQHEAGCVSEIKIDPRLRLAAQWHTDDLMNNHNLDGDAGTDGTTTQDRAQAAGFKGIASETVAINPSIAINNLEIINRWYYDPGYYAIMSNCANTAIGVWSANSLTRSVVVAVYGQPT
ncbi:CAP domain-containing protein [Mycobacterium sp. E1747]|uniref:CAP domain-containing protein n=1 Tax=Mycobacterium sp. E1747 TaxID=1834128 RepID=UPI001E58FDCE|nr:CAP domain-containing protein [Mycobacterium sp. E1747]